MYKKVHSRSISPFKINKKINFNAYVLDLLDDVGINSIFMWPILPYIMIMIMIHLFVYLHHLLQKRRFIMFLMIRLPPHTWVDVISFLSSGRIVLPQHTRVDVISFLSSGKIVLFWLYVDYCWWVPTSRLWHVLALYFYILDRLSCLNLGRYDANQT